MDTELLMGPDKATYFAEQTERSDSLVAAGGPPLRRMRAPFVPPFVQAQRSINHRFDGASSWDVKATHTRIVMCRIGTGGLEAATLHGIRGTITPLSAEGLVSTLCHEWSADEPALMVFETLSAARQLWTAAPRFGQSYVDMNAAAADVHRKSAHQLELFAALPTSSRMVVLDKALPQMFWRPSAVGEGGYSQWLRLLSTQTSFEAMRDVLVHLLAGDASKTQVTFLTAMVRAEDQLMSMVSAFRNAGSATHHYTLSTRHMSAFEAYRNSDPSYLMEACSIGTAPWVRPIGVQGGEVVAQLSTPCRLKPGRTRLFAPNGDDLGVAKLRRLTFSERLGLVGVFGSDQAGAKTGSRNPMKSHGYQWLLTEGRRDTGAQAHMVEVPYLGTGGSSTWTWTRDEFKGPQIRRDVPLDVAAAGAGS